MDADSCTPTHDEPPLQYGVFCDGHNPMLM